MLHIDFFVVGTQKAGTTTLHDLLTKHADLNLPKIKETHYFSHSARTARGEDWYASQFPAPLGSRLTGEIDPEYLFAPDSAAAIRATTTARKFVFILRNPVHRAHSQFLMSTHRGYESLSFEHALLAEPERLTGVRAQFAHDHWSYVARSLYAGQIETFLRVFPDADFLFLNSENLTEMTGTSGYHQICRFIGSDPLPNAATAVQRSNSASQPRSKLLRNLIYAPEGKSSLRTAATSMLPSAVKANLFNLIENVNRKPVSINHKVLPNLPGDVLNKMLGDVTRCEKLTGLDLSAWREDIKLRAKGN